MTTRSALRYAIATLLVCLAGGWLGGCLTRLNSGPGVYCDAENPCTGQSLVCDPRSHTCVVSANVAYCDATTACPSNQPLCDYSAQTCRPCSGPTGDAACGAQYPDRPFCLKGACVACRSTGDCSSGTLICDEGTGTCRACRTNDECPSQVCLGDGNCAADGDVLYVNNGDVNCASGDGTRAKPLCEIADAIAYVPVHRIIRVAGSGTNYRGPLVFDNGDMRIVGPGRLASPTARLATGTASCVTLTGSANNVTIDGLELYSCAGDGITCEFANLTLLRSLVRGAQQAGLSAAAACNVTLDQDVFTKNQDHALYLTAGCTYDITNCFIYENGSTVTPKGAAVQIDGNAHGRFAFNTVANNSASGAGGVICGGGQTIEASIVYGNTSSAGSQLDGCGLQSVVVNDGDTANGIHATLAFDPAYAYHLVGSDLSCIDVVHPPDGGTSALPDHDGDGHPRPIGSGWDVGAHEYAP